MKTTQAALQNALQNRMRMLLASSSTATARLHTHGSSLAFCCAQTIVTAKEPTGPSHGDRAMPSARHAIETSTSSTHQAWVNTSTASVGSTTKRCVLAATTQQKHAQCSTCSHHHYRPPRDCCMTAQKQRKKPPVCTVACAAQAALIHSHCLLHAEHTMT